MASGQPFSKTRVFLKSFILFKESLYNENVYTYKSVDTKKRIRTSKYSLDLNKKQQLLNGLRTFLSFPDIFKQWSKTCKVSKKVLK